MSSQVYIAGNEAAAAFPAINLGPNFQIDVLDAKYSKKLQTSQASPPLGVLSAFKGEFTGRGLNTIFRPNSGLPTTTTFPNPITPAAPTPPSENVLEINLTNETITFSSAIGNVPNRGLETQNDIFLNGIPYVQAVNDVSNPATGKADGTPVGIHFETGMWVHVPATSTDPVVPTSLVRMGSIPHGTTINAQALEPTATITGPPTFAPVDITPFVIGNPAKRIPFISQTASNTATPRLPQDLTPFISAGTITQAMLTDPNTVLREAIAGQKILDFVVFTVSTASKAPELGGGTANIGFLQGSSTAAENANAIQMTATFWIETVQYDIVVPPFEFGSAPLKISPSSSNPRVPVPVFKVNPPYNITEPTTITVTSTQIQYSQLVLLSFAGLTWPHASVSTLVPIREQEVPPEVWN
jgi:hypothetical protein